MNMVVWGIVGLLEGWIASKWVERKDQYLTADMIIGMLGAIVGGMLLYSIKQPVFLGFLAVYSGLASVVIAILALIPAVFEHQMKEQTQDYSDDTFSDGEEL